MGDKEIKEQILKKVEALNGAPFILKDLEHLNASSKTLRETLERLVKENILSKRVLGRMSVYWKSANTSDQKKAKTASEMPFNQKNGFTPEKKRIKDLEAVLSSKNKQINQLELEINELREEVMDLRAKVRELQLAEGIDDPWKEVAMRMAEILAEMRGMTIKEVLLHFGVREEMI